MKKDSSGGSGGFTLVEVLAALVILGIIFTGIVAVFPQMTLFNKVTEAKLDTMNLARQEIAEVTARDNWIKQLQPIPVNPTPADSAAGVPDHLSEAKITGVMTGEGYALTGTTTDYFRYQKDDGYRFEADVYAKCVLYSDSAIDLTDAETSSTGACAEREMKKLYKVHLKVYKEAASNPGTYQLSSETFSYIAYTALPPAPVAAPAPSGGG
ncbi:PulJ/GspJ family protein [Indiicoccus explosivorum]|uniref:PulJ/GspJ family protein n=1 Tax=Indiicoccus explosivorum TaxID=1917864 RepID=UPI00138FB14B|nr:type II secretion system protein [Indiicoccus explosivorum]